MDFSNSVTQSLVDILRFNEVVIFIVDSQRHHFVSGLDTIYVITELGVNRPVRGFIIHFEFFSSAARSTARILQVL